MGIFTGGLHAIVGWGRDHQRQFTNKALSWACHPEQLHEASRSMAAGSQKGPPIGKHPDSLGPKKQGRSCWFLPI